ncbi:MAG: heterocyst frequency control protein PatD [Elainellaceae cyanobacterium]
MEENASVDGIQALLARLQTCVASLTSPQTVPAEVATQIESLYQQVLQGFDVAQYRPSRQPYVTEFHKQLRLLGTDIIFLKAARQTATRAQHLQSIRDRLQALQGYHSAMTHPEPDAP